MTLPARPRADTPRAPQEGAAAAPTALIAEDEPLLAASLAADLARLWPGLQLLASVGNGAAAVEQALRLRPTVCFFDIRMPGLSGLEAAQALAEDWPEDEAPFPLLVFVTAYDEYAIQAFEREAVDYLLKPIDDPRLGQCLQRLQRRIAQRGSEAQPPAPAGPDGDSLQQALAPLRALLDLQPRVATTRLEVIQAGSGNTVVMVPVDEVLYFEAADKYLRVVTADKEHLIRLSLRDLLPQLDEQRFWQVHRSTVVQARSITRAQRDEAGKLWVTLRDRPERLAVSRLFAHRFKAM